MIDDTHMIRKKRRLLRDDDDEEGSGMLAINFTPKIYFNLFFNGCTRSKNNPKVVNKNGVGPHARKDQTEPRI